MAIPAPRIFFADGRRMMSDGDPKGEAGFGGTGGEKKARMRKEKRFINEVNLKKRTLFFVCGHSFRLQSVSRTSRLLAPHPRPQHLFFDFTPMLNYRLGPPNCSLFFLLFHSSIPCHTVPSFSPLWFVSLFRSSSQLVLVFVFLYTCILPTGLVTTF